MYYIDISEYGGPEVMTMKKSPIPEPKAYEILIKVVAAGVNRPDILQRQGLYPGPHDASPVLGLEVAGEVVKIGDKVTDWSPADKVCALVNGGGYAEYVVVPSGQVLPIPMGLSIEEAAALPETFFTVWTNVFDRAALKAGEQLMVHGGSSGIGTTAIQFGKAMGAKVFVTAGSEVKCEACRRLGADIAINYHRDDYVSIIHAATEGKGVDVILDMVGGDYIQRNLKVAARGGRIVNIAYLKGSKVEIDMLPILVKHLTLTGSTLRPRSTEEKACIALALRKNIWPLIARGQIKPQIAARFPLKDVADAHKLMERGEHIGKIILIV
ncbi:MAG: NAD(P)H-quinone oxidoreductase [Desulfobulbus sp.]